VLATEEDVFVHGIAGGVRFCKNFAAGAVPIELAANLGNAATIRVVAVSYAIGSFDFAFRIPGVGKCSVA